MLARYLYPFILFIYISGCGGYEPYLLHANRITKSNTIKRFSSEDTIPDLSNEWKKTLAQIVDLNKRYILENNIKQLSIEDRDGLWRLFISIPPLQRPYFLQDLISFNQSEQAALLDVILYLEHRDEKLIEAALRGNAIYLPIFEQLKLTTMLQDLKASDQTLLARFEARLGYNQG